MASTSGVDVFRKHGPLAPDSTYPYMTHNDGTFFLKHGMNSPENFLGYYGFDWAWRIRGLLDVLAGGVGLRRGRRHPTEIRPGDAIDFWRVADVDEGHRLELAAEMKLPGEAWLVWTVNTEDQATVISQEAYFQPRGLLGRLYWYCLSPFHGLIFQNMLSNIAKAAERRNRSSANS